MKTPIYFASGSNRPADIRGFAAIGHAIGVAAPEVSPAAEKELCALKGMGIPVFVDSGAFSEVEFGPEGVKVVAEITEGEWRKRLALYARIAKALGPMAYLVAPDRIGNQEETLKRLATFAKEVREIRAMGAKILVPIQKGTKTQAEFVKDVEQVLGFSDFVHAIPSKKKATTLEELEAYLKAVRPKEVHFLGLGIKNANAPAVLELLKKYVPQVAASFDSNLIAATVGRGKDGKKPRVLTAARDKASEMIAKGETHIESAQELGIILAFGNGLAASSAA